jgi:steroid delta-isomerase-like uncharacterized protein
MGAKENADLAVEIYQLFNTGRLDEAAGYATDDMDIQLLPFGQTFSGPDGFRDFMNGFKGGFPDIKITVVNQVADDDQVVSECRWSGTHDGPLQAPTGEIAPTGQAVSDARFCEVWRIRDGKVASLTNYQDAATWLRQLGLVD